jgi:hypothetical protein
MSDTSEGIMVNMNTYSPSVQAVLDAPAVDHLIGGKQDIFLLDGVLELPGAWEFRHQLRTEGYGEVACDTATAVQFIDSMIDMEENLLFMTKWWKAIGLEA